MIKCRLRRRAKLLEIYGGVCACCGETNPLFLTIDHINNDGYKKTSSSAALGDAVKNIDKSKYQTLCFNCNCGKNRNKGVCPHKGQQ
jgi:hypothetical protein